MKKGVDPDETIAAIATGVGGGIGILRISGAKAVEVAAQVVRPWPSSLESHRMWRAWAEGDEILCVVMRSPRSYTGEDVVELQGHGGALSLRRLLSAVVAAGARIAEPGEFTKRAFLSGRLDLAQAEAVADLIGARSERALSAAQANLRGALSSEVARLRQALVALLAELEAQIDFPEEQLEMAQRGALAEAAVAAREGIEKLAATWRQARLWAEGVSVALVGPPNVGKSSLFNALVGRERALVTPEAGTTRDYLETTVEWDGLAITLVDTAGDRDASDPVEKRAIALGRGRIEEAQIIVRVCDARCPVVECEPGEILVWNKSDLLGADDASEARREVRTSAVMGHGIDRLRRTILDRVGSGVHDGGDEAVVSNERQRRALEEAVRYLDQASIGLEKAMPAEIVAVDIRGALDQLGLVIGESLGDAVLDEIFARFCIGK